MDYGNGAWYCWLWMVDRHLFMSEMFRVPEGEPIPEKPETLPSNWEDIRKKMRADGITVIYERVYHSLSYYDWRMDHSTLKASWHGAARGMIVINNGNAVVLMPPSMNTQANRKSIRVSTFLKPGNGIHKVRYTIDPSLEGGKATPQEQILVDHTDNGEMICVCDGCRCTKTPHFFWYPKRGKPVCLMIEAAIILSNDTNMNLKNRYRLQKYLTIRNWYRLIRAWNSHNETEVSLMQHIPDYINLQTNKTIFNGCKIRKNNKVIADAIIYWKDEDARPHFHYTRLNGTEVMISLTDAHYLEPALEKLSNAEKKALVESLEKDGEDFRKCAGIVLEEWSGVTRDKNIFPLPDYMKLK